jgi:hypothetical protein
VDPPGAGPDAFVALALLRRLIRVMAAMWAHGLAGMGVLDVPYKVWYPNARRPTAWRRRQS